MNPTLGKVSFFFFNIILPYGISISIWLLLFGFWFFGGYEAGKLHMARSAIKSGVGHYVVTDQQRQEVEFQWITATNR
jgi:hypothetical protein